MHSVSFTSAFTYTHILCGVELNLLGATMIYSERLHCELCLPTLATPPIRASCHDAGRRVSPRVDAPILVLTASVKVTDTLLLSRISYDHVGVGDGTVSASVSGWHDVAVPFGV